MTQKQIDGFTRLHTSRLNRVIAILEENYYRFEENEDETHYQYWISEFRKEKQILDWLSQQQPDER